MSCNDLSVSPDEPNIMVEYPTRKIGSDNVSAIGFGAMGISAFYGQPEPDEERFKVGGGSNYHAIYG